MKTTLRFVAALAVLCLCHKSASSQHWTYNERPDTLEIDLGGQSSLWILSPQAGKYLTAEDIPIALKDIRSSLKVVPHTEPLTVTYHIRKGENAKSIMKISSLPEQEYRLTKKGDKISTAANTLTLYYKKEKVIINLESISLLDRLATVEFEGLFAHVEEYVTTHNVKHKRRHKLHTHGSLIDNRFKGLKTSHGPSSADFVSLGAGIGMALIRNTLAPELSLGLDFNFRDKFNQPRSKFGLLLNNYYLFERDSEGGFHTDLNTFLKGYYAINLFGGEEPIWTGLGIGYLVANNGGYFKGDTYSLSASFHKEKRKLNIGGDLIFTDNFKSVFPLVKIGIDF